MLTEAVKSQIEQAISTKAAVLFMKGTPSFPQCGFSARAVAILRELDVDFHSVDVLENQEIRQGIKEFSNWPTIPQFYFNKELVGGSDILMEMFESGELEELVKA